MFRGKTDEILPGEGKKVCVLVGVGKAYRRFPAAKLAADQKALQTKPLSAKAPQPSCRVDDEFFCVLINGAKWGCIRDKYKTTQETKRRRKSSES